ncbi:MAG: DUF2007 domain-containing protein [Anaerolineales bacterium]|jgi:hypothetical protein
MEEMKWDKLAEVYGRLEAEAVKSFLEAEGIQVELIQEAIGQLIPTNYDAFGRVQIFVPKEQFEEAEKLYESYQNATPTNNGGEQ